MATLAKLVHELRSDEPAAADNHNLHDESPLWFVAPESGQVPPEAGQESGPVVCGSSENFTTKLYKYDPARFLSKSPD